MKKYMMIALILCGVIPTKAVESNQSDVTVFDKKLYSVRNLKKTVHKCISLAWQVGKMYAGCEVLRSAPGWQRANGLDVVVDNAGPLGWYTGGGLLFAHGVRGFIKECGFESFGSVMRYLENK